MESGNCFSKKQKMVKEHGDQIQEEEWISKLPDGILGMIMCKLLSVREIGRTSLVCRRWEKLWMDTVAVAPRLEFDAGESLKKKGGSCRTSEVGMMEYVNWVNDLVKLHQAPNLEEFTIVYPLNSKHSDEINRWIEFAFEKGVQKLKLDLRPGFGVSIGRPYSILVSSISPLMSTSTSMSMLRDLHMNRVNVCEKVIVDCILANSPFLERLCVINSRGLAKLKVTVAEASNLKCLEIYECHHLRLLHVFTANLEHLVIAQNIRLNRIEISAPSLVSFGYSGPLEDISRAFTDEDVAVCGRLSHLTLELLDSQLVSDSEDEDEYMNPDTITHGFYKLLDHFPTVKRLSLGAQCDLSALGSRGVLNILSGRIGEPHEFPQLRNVEHLELSVPITYPCVPCHSLPCALVKAAPLLSTLSIKLDHKFESVEWKRGVKEHSRNKVRKEFRDNSHEQLKVVKLVGFTGCSNEIELLLHLVDIAAASLEKIIIDVRFILEYWDSGDIFSLPKVTYHPNEFADISRQRAQLLKTQLPSQIDLLIV